MKKPGMTEEERKELLTYVKIIAAEAEDMVAAFDDEEMLPTDASQSEVNSTLSMYVAEIEKRIRQLREYRYSDPVGNHIYPEI